MVIKSGEGVVILTRPQKIPQSSPDPDSLTFFSTCTQMFLPRPIKTDAKPPNIANAPCNNHTIQQLFKKIIKFIFLLNFGLYHIDIVFKIDLKKKLTSLSGAGIIIV